MDGEQKRIDCESYRPYMINNGSYKTIADEKQ